MRALRVKTQAMPGATLAVRRLHSYWNFPSSDFPEAAEIEANPLGVVLDGWPWRNLSKKLVQELDRKT
jgi:hypothetical protein